jgi:hypothetical protein
MITLQWIHTKLYSPELHKCYFFQILKKSCSKVPIFYFNGPKRPSDNCYVTCLLREKSALDSYNTRLGVGSFAAQYGRTIACAMYQKKIATLVKLTVGNVPSVS